MAMKLTSFYMCGMMLVSRVIMYSCVRWTNSRGPTCFRCLTRPCGAVDFTVFEGFLDLVSYIGDGCSLLMCLFSIMFVLHVVCCVCELFVEYICYLSRCGGCSVMEYDGVSLCLSRCLILWSSILWFLFCGLLCVFRSFHRADVECL